MSYHAEIWRDVDVEWDKSTNFLSIRTRNGEMLALLRVEEVD